MSSLLKATWHRLTFLGTSIGDTLLPRSCQSCDQGLESSERGLCALCWRDLQEAIGQGRYCRRCGQVTGRW